MNNQGQGTSRQELLDWIVRGPAWVFLARRRADFCPVELATTAIESLWSDDDGEAWKSGREEDGQLIIDDDAKRSVSIALIVENSAMASRDEHIIIPSCLVLANAGFHAEADRLASEWEKAGEEARLASLLFLLRGR